MAPDHWVLVTGGSRGIGRAVALAFAEAGWPVLAVGRDQTALQAVSAAAAGLPGRVLPVVADARDRQALVAALAVHLPAEATLAVVVVNAGISLRTPVEGPAEVDAAWREQIETNLTGAWHAIRAALPRCGQGARLILMASDLGRLGAEGFSAYAASKHGMIGLCRALAAELAPQGITVNAVCPGWVDTGMAARSFEEMADMVGLPAAEVAAAETEALPLGRLLRPREIADLVLFLAGPAGAVITGQSYGIDAGTTPFA